MSIFLIFFIMVLGGVILEDIIMKIHYRLTKKHYKEHHFTFGKYLFLLLGPLMGTGLLISQGNLVLINVFLTFSIVGTFIEYAIGFFYHGIIGQRLWTYHRYPIGNRYTSFLSIPFWGLGGILFWLLAKVFI